VLLGSGLQSTSAAVTDPSRQAGALPRRQLRQPEVGLPSSDINMRRQLQQQPAAAFVYLDLKAVIDVGGANVGQVNTTIFPYYPAAVPALWEQLCPAWTNACPALDPYNDQSKLQLMVRPFTFL
jgi:hypothetical protein